MPEQGTGPGGVDLLGAHPKRVPRAVADEEPAASGRVEPAAQLADVRPQRCQRPVRGVTVPDRLDQAVGCDDLVNVQQQDREQRFPLLSAKNDHIAVAGDLGGAEDCEMQVLFVWHVTFSRRSRLITISGDT